MPTTAGEISTLDTYWAELKKSGTVVIDFYSTQCPPCKVIAPVYEKIAADPAYADVRFFKVNGLVEPGSSVQKEADVVWWPTLVVYEDGTERWRRKVPNPPSLEPLRELDQYLGQTYKS